MTTSENTEEVLRKLSDHDQAWEQLEESLRMKSRHGRVIPEKLPCYLFPIFVTSGALWFYSSTESNLIKSVCLIAPPLSVWLAIWHYRAAVRYGDAESSRLYQRRAIVLELEAIRTRSSDREAIESLDRYWEYERARLVRSAEGLKMPWEREVGNGWTLIAIGILAIIISLLTEPAVAFTGGFPIILGIVQFIVWRRIHAAEAIYQCARQQILNQPRN